jgi:hypothetical protein
VHALDERVLRDDDACDLRSIVLDPAREPARFELAEEPRLTDVSELP